MNNLEKLRKAKNEKQIDVAKALGVPQITYSRWERGINYPKKERLFELAAHFGVTVDDIFSADMPVRPPLVRIPVLGDIAAGVPIDMITDILDWEYISAEMAARGEFYGLRVAGDSMLPYIGPGDVLVCRRVSAVDSGKVAIVRVARETATCKKLYYHNEGVELRSYNEAKYPPMRYSRRDVAFLPVEVCGEVIEVRKKSLP